MPEHSLTGEIYFNGFAGALSACLADKVNHKGLEAAVALLKNVRRRRATVFLIGNGGSAAIAEHMAVDLTKMARVRAMAMSGSPLLTAFANDCGYDKVFEKSIDAFANDKDVLFAISSGGKSKSILNACRAARRKKMTIVTFSGFDAKNPLRRLGDINIWVNARSFGYVETIHHLLIHYINDAIIGKAEYTAKDLA